MCKLRLRESVEVTCWWGWSWIQKKRWSQVSWISVRSESAQPAQPEASLSLSLPGRPRPTPNSRVSLCFPVKEGYKVRSDVNITLEFRTSSENGVLLGISSAKVDAIGLEIVNGKVGASSRWGSPSPQCQRQSSWEILRSKFLIIHFNGMEKRFS